MASRYYNFLPQANTDAIEVALYIAKDDLNVADHFLSTLDGVCDKLATMPQMGSLYTNSGKSFKKIRMLPVPGYEKILIFYHPITDGIEVVRILHSARDIRYINIEE